MRPTKRERLRLFFEALQTAPPAATTEAGFALVCETLNAVEDRYSGVPFDPASWHDDGRLYPPQVDNRKSFAPASSLIRYRSREHYLWIDGNGAILITDIDDPPHVLVTKPGSDGRSIREIPSWMMA